MNTITEYANFRTETQSAVRSLARDAYCVQGLRVIVPSIFVFFCFFQYLLKYQQSCMVHTQRQKEEDKNPKEPFKKTKCLEVRQEVLYFSILSYN